MNQFCISKDQIIKDVVGKPFISQKSLLALVSVFVGIVAMLIFVKIPIGVLFFLIMVDASIFFFLLFVVLPEEKRRSYLKRKLLKNEYFIQKYSVASVEEKVFSSDAGVIYRMKYRTFFHQCEDFYDFDEKVNIGDDYYLVFLKNDVQKQDQGIYNLQKKPKLVYAYPASHS